MKFFITFFIFFSGRLLISEEFQLYIKKECPYCKDVISFLNHKGITVTYLDLEDPLNEKALIEVGGKKQVPCLMINGKALYESKDIISYLSH